MHSHIDSVICLNEVTLRQYSYDHFYDSQSLSISSSSREFPAAAISLVDMPIHPHNVLTPRALSASAERI